ncbi:hypothetical protein J437_LFUL012568 [Ladona fulva]|uniref:Integrin alpha third immunoglobulin-like domain-containing protein n=1 Tax=Ladona fulva TaxID=123851 RepID=A0A8K0P8A9_LADFU|nr:hypothetical protein J437_LFUL012568 [Ladona fulva]
MKSRYEFHMTANSTNPEAESSKFDNSLIFTIPIWVETDLIIEGSSNPPELYYNSSLYGEKNLTHEADIGPQVLHFYNIRNKGPSDILEAVAYVLWPTYTVAGDPLLYLVEQPELSGPIKCEPVEHVNEMNLIIDRKKKSSLDFLKFKNELDSGQDTGIQVEEYSEQEVVSREESSRSRKIYSSSWSSFSSSSSEEHVEGGRRVRRQTTEESQSEKDDGHQCGPTNCSKYQCTIGPLTKDQDAWIVFRSRVDVRTLKKFGAMEVRVSSKLTAKVARLPHIGPPDYLIVPKSREVYTTFIPTDGERLSEKIVPWWVVVLSACAGTVILLLLIFLLWKLDKELLLIRS